MTDRFVNGDPSNDQRDQGGTLHTFNIPLPPCNGVSGNIGYMGGDFKGIAAVSYTHLDVYKRQAPRCSEFPAHAGRLG